MREIFKNVVKKNVRSFILTFLSMVLFVLSSSATLPAPAKAEGRAQRKENPPGSVRPFDFPAFFRHIVIPSFDSSRRFSCLSSKRIIFAR